MALTHKQETFARLIAKGETQSEAYRQAYSAENMKPESIWRKASEAGQHVAVSARIRELQAAQEIRQEHDAVSIRRIALETLLDMAQRTSIQPSVRVRAAELLGKVKGVDLFGDAAPSDSPTRADLSDLERQLRAFIQSKTPIDPKTLIDQQVDYSRPEQSDESDSETALDPGEDKQD